MGEEIWEIMEEYKETFKTNKEFFKKRIGSKFDIIHEETEFSKDKNGNWILQFIFLIRIFNPKGKGRSFTSYCWIEFNSSKAILYGVTRSKSNKAIDYVLFRKIEEVEEYYRVLRYDIEVNNYGMRKEAQENYEKNK